MTAGPVPEADVDLGSGRLRCWDTGGPGEPVVLLHAAAGHGGVWAHQHASLGRAGFRSISYSRRGHRGSPAAGAGAVTASADLLALADALGLHRFHVAGTAHGGFAALAVALEHPDRLLSLTVSSSLCGISDPGFVAETRRSMSPAERTRPVADRELGPVYRAADPAGTRAWADLVGAPVVPPQRPERAILLADLGSLCVPAQFITGDADPYMPPARMRRVATAASAPLRIIRDCGHSPYWEQPEIFDRLLLRHLTAAGRAGRQPPTTEDPDVSDHG